MWPYIYNWPALLAKRIKPGWYVTTESVRNYLMAPRDLRRTLCTAQNGTLYIDYLPAKQL